MLTSSAIRRTSSALLLMLWSVAPSFAQTFTELRMTMPPEVVHVGDTIQLTVIGVRQDGSTEDVTAASTGTRYVGGRDFVVSGDGAVTIDSASFSSTAFPSLTSVFAVNGDAAGAAVRYQAAQTAQLRVSADGQSLSAPAGRLTVRVGQQVQLKVEVIEQDGRSTDVTNDPNTRYLVGPGVVSVSASGLLSVREPTPDERHRALSALIEVAHMGVALTDDSRVVTVIVDVEYRDPDALIVTAATKTLRVGETTSVVVTYPDPGGSRRDVTSHPDTKYSTSSESLAVVDAEGRVTCIAVDPARSDSVGIVVHHGDRSGSTRIALAPGGPGPTLDVQVDRTVLREGESTQFRVRRRGDEPHQDLTAAATGTEYLAFAGYGYPEPEVLQIDATGTATALASLGRFNRRHVVVFVRNGDRVGWAQVRIERATR